MSNDNSVSSINGCNDIRQFTLSSGSHTQMLHSEDLLKIHLVMAFNVPKRSM